MEENKKLSVNDPITPEMLNTLRTIEEGEGQIAHRFLELEHERVGLLVTSKNLRMERGKIFNLILSERGLPPNTIIEINDATGKITVLDPLAKP